MSTNYEAIEIIIPQTAAKSDVLYKITQENLTVILFIVGATGTDKIPIKFSPDNGVTKVAQVITGTAMELSVANTSLLFRGPIAIVFDKPITTGTVGVYATQGVYV